MVPAAMAAMAGGVRLFYQRESLLSWLAKRQRCTSGGLQMEFRQAFRTHAATVTASKEGGPMSHRRPA